MAQFHVFEHSQPAQGYPQYVAVKDGWCWSAFCGTWGWAFATRLHRLGALLLGGWFVGIVGLFFLLSAMGKSIWILMFILLGLNVCVRLYLGAQGNELRRAYLRQRGYYLAQTVSASTRTAALKFVGFEQ